MSNKDSFNKKRRFSYCEAALKDRHKPPKEVELIRKKSFNENNFTFKPVIPSPTGSPLLQKKPLNLKPKAMWNPRKPKKCYSKKDQPNTPHNTTQFLVNASNMPNEDYNLGPGEDRFKYDFEHHAMAGSMMGIIL